MRRKWILGLLCTVIVAACSAGAGKTQTGSDAGAGGGTGNSTGSKAGSGGLTTSSGSTGNANGGSTGALMLPDSGPPDSSCANPVTCMPDSCGKISDGCGGIIDCGMSCPAGQTCGGGGTASVCGSSCVPTTCTALGYNCGIQGDGCGNTLDCGMCTMPDTCGGGGMSSVCGHTTICMPATCASLNSNCGSQGDGCGGTLDCGTCGVNQACSGTPSVCVATCTPLTCATAGAAACGATPDGCGGLLQCGGCSQPTTCGGGGLTAGQCGVPPSCTGLCLKQVTCSNPAVTTTMSGTVYAPNGVDPLPNVLVYVPNGGPAPTYGVQPFTPGVACEPCSAGVSGSPLVSAATDTTGHFSLQNVPVGASIPLVIQTGRWRRQVTVPTVTACQDNPVAASLTNLPPNKTVGDIPHMAFVTGAVDSLECVMRKIGVQDAEFTQPSGTGRINLYVGDGTVSVPGQGTYHLGGANAGAGTPSETTLVNTPATLDEYDMLLFACKGSEHDRTAAQQTNVINYANAGGRIFATHFSYVWLFNDAPFNGTASWNVGQCDPFTSPDACTATIGYPPDQTGFIDTTFPKGLALAQWLQNIGASTTLGQIPLDVIRWDTTNPGAVSPSQEWMQIQDAKIGNVLMHYTFNTPVGTAPASQCGRVLFDDFHVENHGYINADSAYNLTFPAECACEVDSNYCESNVECCSFRCDLNPNSATYETCLGPAGGCLENNKACSTSGQCCGGVCTGGACVAPMTPQEKLLEFMIFDLGSCVTPDIPMCTPTTCTAQNISCGPAGDGCGNVLQCGMCPSGQTCGGGGTPSACGAPSCTPTTCMSQNIQCGPAGDGCGNLIQCGMCPSGTCGGGGVAGVCGAGTCTPTTCSAQNIHCGPAGDGCGNQLSCGTCPAGQTCGGGGTPGVCGSTCVPKTCIDLGYNCGPAADGCGNQLNCGTCSAPQTCGGGGKANVCGGGVPT